MRLTNKSWRNLDPWECCGQDNFCKRGCHEEGGCNNGCIVPKNYRRLATYEDSGLSPEEVQEFAKAKAEGRLVVLDERLAISMCAGARAIETNINRMAKRYVYDVQKLEPTISYLEAARILREAAEKAIVEVREPHKTVPQSCYTEFGADLDGCSRQENQGCTGCRCLEVGK